MTRQIKIIMLGIFLTLSEGTANSESNRPIFKQIVCTVKVNKINPRELSIELADTDYKRSYGLMNREDMKSNSGMLFVWKDRQIRNFWMKNTHFNLDLFFLNNQGEIIEIYKNAKAFDETNIKSRNKVNFVVELKSGEYPLLIGDKFNCLFKELLKDENNIYLKAEYDITESSEIRSKLTQTVIQDPSSSNRIMTLALDLHKKDGNIRAEFFGKDQNIVSSILYSDSAHINNRYNNMIAEGNVVIYSPKTNLMLLGNKVLWDNRAKRILSEENVTIVKVTENDQIPCVQKSIGFESDIDLSNYIFYNIKGQIGEDCF